MEWLGAGLAFAITMLALSTVVTTTVETIHRIIGLREKGLCLMLGHFYDGVIAPHVDRAFGAGTAERDRKDFLEAMTANRAPAGNARLSPGTNADRAGTVRKDVAAAPSTGSAAAEGTEAAVAPNVDSAETEAPEAPEAAVAAKVGSSPDRKFLSWIWGGRTLGSLPLDDFMARLGDSHYGDAVAQVQAAGGMAAADVVLQDIAHKFEAYGRDASEYFQARARLVSVLVAFVIAWQCYVNPLLLARTFLRNPDVTAKVIEQGPKFIDQSKQAEEKLAATVAAARGEQAAAAADALPAADEKVADAEQSLASIRDSKRQAEEILALGVPIGWTDARLKEAGFDRTWFWLVYPTSLSRGLASIAWLLLGGLLIGLGSPFWRDAVLSLTAFRDRAKTAAAAAEAAGRDPLVVAAERFVTASQARAAAHMTSTDDDTEAAVG